MAAATPKMSLYDVPPSPPMWDQVGIFFISYCTVWTTLVFSGMAFLWFNRHLPILKIRGLPLSFAAITFLHMYWILAQLVYPIGRAIPVILAYDIQYFFMGIWFPLGIAMFHASNSRFLHVAKLQKQFTQPELRSKTGCNGAKTSWLCRLRNIEYSKRIMLFIGIGMIAQVLLTVGMWVACRKYHPTFGIPGTELRGDTIPEQLIDLGRGWEWWPSVLWQVIWTWIVAPILIWRAWGIHDTMGWRTQTIGCCISNLHATPMFLIASYVPAFNPVNAYFPPSQWIHLSILMFEIFTIFVPVFQVIRHWILSKKAAEANSKWETESQTTTLRTLTSSDWKMSSLSITEKGLNGTFYLDEEMGDRLLTMTALDHVLNENPGPLQDFSSLRDFSGENIAFLTRTSRWKSSWPEIPEDEEQRRDAYNYALAIYTDFISPRDAEFPLNLSSQDLKQLEDIFEKPTRIICGEPSVNPATPFAFEPEQSRENSLGGKAQYTGEIPAGFSADIFDAARSHIRLLVFTNTWPKFVVEIQQRRRSSDTGESHFTSTSQGTLKSRVSDFIHSIF